MDVYRFPFDTQQCDLSFRSLLLSANGLIIIIFRTMNYEYSVLLNVNYYVFKISTYSLIVSAQTGRQFTKKILFFIKIVFLCLPPIYFMTLHQGSSMRNVKGPQNCIEKDKSTRHLIEVNNFDFFLFIFFEKLFLCILRLALLY